MECSICYESFIFPKTKEELMILQEKYYKESKEKYEKMKLKNNDKLEEDKGLIEYINKMSIFEGLVITNKHNLTYKCITNNCSYIICGFCLERLKSNGKSPLDMTDNDIINSNRLIKCPNCRTYDFKEYMKNVLHELKFIVAKKNNKLDDYSIKLEEDIVSLFNFID